MARAPSTAGRARPWRGRGARTGRSTTGRPGRSSRRDAASIVATGSRAAVGPPSRSSRRARAAGRLGLGPGLDGPAVEAGGFPGAAAAVSRTTEEEAGLVAAAVVAHSLFRLYQETLRLGETTLGEQDVSEAQQLRSARPGSRVSTFRSADSASRRRRSPPTPRP